MKRNFGKKLIIGAALCCLPFSAMALEALDDSALGGVTGQAGVSIALDDVVIYMKSIADVTYIDTDGLGAAATAGIKISHGEATEKLITLDAILDGSKYGTAAIDSTFGFTGAAAGKIGIFDTSVFVDTDGGTTAAQKIAGAGFDPSNGSMGNIYNAAGQIIGKNTGSNFTNGISPLTIDVGEAQALTHGWKYNTNVGAGTGQNATDPTGKGDFVAGVIIGLPTVEISTYYGAEGETKTISLVEVTGKDSQKAINNNHDFIQIKKANTASTMAILGGRLEIAPH